MVVIGHDCPAGRPSLVFSPPFLASTAGQRFDGRAWPRESGGFRHPHRRPAGLRVAATAFPPKRQDHGRRFGRMFQLPSTEGLADPPARPRPRNDAHRSNPAAVGALEGIDRCFLVAHDKMVRVTSVRAPSPAANSSASVLTIFPIATGAGILRPRRQGYGRIPPSRRNSTHCAIFSAVSRPQGAVDQVVEIEPAARGLGAPVGAAESGGERMPAHGCPAAREQGRGRRGRAAAHALGQRIVSTATEIGAIAPRPWHWR